jgi:N-dimethylarginine dimethylaminohydrolase
LLCPPDYFDTHFLFNPFMSFREKVNPRRARSQWRRLVCAVEAAGAEVELMEPDPVTSALPFTADGALCYAPGWVLILRNDGPRGDLEPPVFTRWFQARGYRTEALPPNYRLDGGNLLRLEARKIAVGLKPGAGGMPERYLERLLRLTTGAETVGVRLVDQRYLHLDMVVGVLGDSALLVYHDGLLERRLPDDTVFAEREVIAVSAEDARQFGCNAITIGEVVITGPVSDALARTVRTLGFQLERLDLSEFYKAGGGAKCLTLPL